MRRVKLKIALRLALEALRLTVGVAPARFSAR